jgi:hypothetical protein
VPRLHGHPLDREGVRLPMRMANASRRLCRSCIGCGSYPVSFAILRMAAATRPFRSWRAPVVSASLSPVG